MRLHINEKARKVIFKAEVVDENTLRTIPESDVGCVPNLVVVGPAVLAKNRQIDIR